MKYKVLIQPDEMLCGVTCLGMIISYYGIDNISLTTIRNFAQTDREGNTINSLCIAAEKLHMNAKGIKCVKEAILNKKVKLPLIVHTLVDGLYNHYMVLFEANEKRVVLGDPAQGQIEMTWDDFEQIWTKKAITLEPTESFSENKKYKRNYKFLINLIIKFKKQIIIMAIFTGIISGINMVSTWFYSYLLDSILPDSKLKLLLIAVAGVCGVFLLTIELNVMKEKFNIKFNKALDKELIVNIYNRITNLPMSFFAMRTTGDVQARFQDGDTLRSTITDFSLDILIDICYAIWSLILVLSINWQIVVISVVMQELMWLAQKIYQKRINNQMKDVMKKSVDVESFVMASFDANETVKNYNSEKLMEKRMAEKYKAYQDAKYKNSVDTEMESSVVSAINNIGLTFMLGVLGIFVMDGSITAGKLVSAYMYVNYIFTPITSIMGMREQLAQTSATLERLDDVFRTTTEEEEDNKKINLEEDIEQIEFRDVVFQYGLRKPTLKGINFTVNKGESIGIIGESGCGKTTLIKLIMGFFNANDGKILINGKDMNSFTKSSIRKRMAYVSQEDYWFQDTIYNNLTIGKEKATNEDLDRVCKMVKMDDYIKKSPYGYNSMIEEGAINLSSGQKQRFSIAKALVTNPEVLILDESTANLDASTEEYVVEQLRGEVDKIKIIVAHRLNTLIHCNKIISMKDGVIVEAGTPQELLKHDGMFKELWAIQNRVFDNMEANDENNEEGLQETSYSIEN